MNAEDDLAWDVVPTVAVLRLPGGGAGGEREKSVIEADTEDGFESVFEWGEDVP